MATFNQVAVIIAEQLKRPLDETFRALIKERIKAWRSRLLRNSLDKEVRERKFFSQPITVPMEEVNAIDCGINLNCRLMRSKTKVPVPVRANGFLFDLVAGVDGSMPFRLVRRHELSYLIGDKYAPLVSDFYLYEDGYLLTRTAPYLFVDGVFDDPEAVAQFKSDNCEDDTNCPDVEDGDIAVSGDIEQLIIQSILQVDYGQPKKDEPEPQEVQVTEK